MDQKDYIALEDCEDGWLYYISARNASVGIFRQATSGFVIPRNKFDHDYLFEEYHWDTGPPFGTVCPLVKLERVPPSLAGRAARTDPGGRLLEYLMRRQREVLAVYRTRGGRG